MLSLITKMEDPDPPHLENYEDFIDSYLLVRYLDESNRIIGHPDLTFQAERPPPPHHVQQKLMMAAEENGRYFLSPLRLFFLSIRGPSLS